MPYQLEQAHNAGGRLLRGLYHYAAAWGKRRGYFPGGHQQLEVPGNDLPDHADMLMHIDTNGGIVQFADSSFFAADNACEIAEVIYYERK
jgi:hypothetical protein